MTNGILFSVNAKNKLYKIYLHERTHESQQRYKRYRNVLIGAIREAKKNYYQKALLKCKADGKETWKILKEITGKRKVISPPTAMSLNGTLVTDEAKVANILNDFFHKCWPIFKCKCSIKWYGPSLISDHD